MKSLGVNEEVFEKVKNLSTFLYQEAHMNQVKVDSHVKAKNFVDRVLKSTYLQNLCLGEVFNFLSFQNCGQYCEVLKKIFMTQKVYLKVILYSVFDIFERQQSEGAKENQAKNNNSNNKNLLQ